MARAVRYDHYGERDVLRVDSVEMPKAVPNEVVVQVRAAGMNPGEIAIRKGFMESRYPNKTWPSGQGSDLAGVVAEVGQGVTSFKVGDEVLGYSWRRSSHASHCLVPASQLIHKPSALSWPVAGSFYVVACTSYAAVRVVDPKPGEVVAVSAAAGGVGTLVVQLLKARGVTTLGIASDANKAFLESHNAKQVPYGPGLADRLRKASPSGKVDVFIDLFGPEYVDLAIKELKIPANRVETIISFGKVEEYGIKAEGSAEASTQAVMVEMAGLIAGGQLEIPIVKTFPLDQVQDAYAMLEKRHTNGKIVLIP